MKPAATEFRVRVNGEAVAQAIVDFSDQLEISVVNSSGENGAVLALTVSSPSDLKSVENIQIDNKILSPGDTVTISLEEVPLATATHLISGSSHTVLVPQTRDDVVCSFCGKSKDDVAKMIAGPMAFICNECIVTCQEIVADET